MSILQIFLPIFAGLICWVAIVLRWRLGVYLLAAYTPFTGLIVAFFYPNQLGNLLRDLIVVAPLYVGFFIFRRDLDKVRVPQFLVLIYLIFALIVTIQMANPGVPNFGVAMIGAKVWLFYIPLLFVGAAFVQQRQDLVDLLRVLSLGAWVACGVGIAMWVAGLAGEYRSMVDFFYGSFGRIASGNYTGIGVGDFYMYRIPSTFRFVSQYATYCLFMTFMVLIAVQIDKQPSWRIFHFATMALVVLGGITSGARANFLFIPLAFLIASGLRSSIIGQRSNAAAIMVLVVLGIGFYQFDRAGILDDIVDLTRKYGGTAAAFDLLSGWDKGGLLGQGVGTNTNAARHAVIEGALSQEIRVFLENYYAKAIVELGVVGLVWLLVCFGALLVFMCRAVRATQSAEMKIVGATLTGMIALLIASSIKGWALDNDPTSYFFWLMAGIALRLPLVPVDDRYPAVAGALRRPMPGRSAVAHGHRPV